MKKIVLGTVLLSGLFLTACADDTVASSTAGKISKDELYEEMKESVGPVFLEQLLMSDVLEDRYGDAVTEEQVDQLYQTEQDRMGGEDAMNYALMSQNLTPEQYRENIRLNLLIEEAVKEQANFTEEDVQAAYEEYVPPVTASHILVQDEETANDLLNQLNDGADFAELAKEHSQDSGTAQQGGQITFTTGEMVPEFEEAAFALEEGEMTQEPVQTSYGFHIIQMNEKSEKGTFEEERETVEQLMLEERMGDSAVVQEALSKVVQDANVVINDDDLTSVLQAYMPQPEAEDTSGETDSSEDSAADSASESEDASESSEDSASENTDTSEE